MVKSKTKINKQAKQKQNPELVETILIAKKNDWKEVASILSGPRRLRRDLNLNQINEQTKEKDSVLIPGKVLSQGDLDKKIKIIALNFSEKAIEKIKNSGSEFSYIKDEIKQNPKKDIKILKAELENSTFSKNKGVFKKWK